MLDIRLQNVAAVWPQNVHVVQQAHLTCMYKVYIVHLRVYAINCMLPMLEEALEYSRILLMYGYFKRYILF